MKWLIAVFLLSAAVSAQASQPPFPGKREARKNEQAQTGSQNATPERADTPAAPLGDPVVTINNQPATDGATGEPDQNGTQGKSDPPVPRWYEDWGNWSDIIAAASAVVMAVFTWLLWVVSDLQRKTLDATLSATKDIERAYVHMSHTAPGLDANGVMSVKVINTGNTPATVTDVHVSFVLAKTMAAVPDVPDYSIGTASKDGEGSRAFLSKDGSIFIPFMISKSDFALAEANPSMVLCVAAYADYIDKFGTRHRAGYGRFYDRSRNQRENYSSDEGFNGRSNLAFLPKPRYNYDRPRVRGEGNDWNDKV